jgi:hypothetical protein
MHVPAICQSEDKWSFMSVATTLWPRYSLNNSSEDKIVKVLGEGGFSFVYLAQDEASGVSVSFQLHMSAGIFPVRHAMPPFPAHSPKSLLVTTRFLLTSYLLSTAAIRA